MTNNTTKKTGFKTKIIATVMATICAFTAVSALTITSVSAEENQNFVTATESVINTETTMPKFDKTSARAYTFGAFSKSENACDWDYYVDNTNVDVTCNYNADMKKYTFKVKGKSEGIVNARFDYKVDETEWKSYSVTLNVDANGNVSKM